MKNLRRSERLLPPRRCSIAPMMNRTDRHFRYLMRLVTRRSWLYTEMVVAQALVHGDPARFLKHHPQEGPLALQLGGSDPATLATAARLAEAWGFDEVNLNAGCPSTRVKDGRMGAVLMNEPERVAECVTAMRAACALPVTVKTRIGVDQRDDFAFTCRFLEAVAEAGCRTVIVHARKAWLNGLSPRENRSVPLLDYDRVYALKAHFPKLEIILNGGVNDLETAETMLRRCDGVMFGRAAYARPLLFAQADRRFHGSRANAPALAEVLAAYLDYLAVEAVHGKIPHTATAHLSGLFSGLDGARVTRRRLGELAASRDLKTLGGILAPWMYERAA
ncbi:MAG: tRNA dihydrouridine(20/20a) synthase DusA [Gammaproteobacteria bacterium]|nr:tRNA dihydrouridine(20/20a) synthase DusA [Gammaproteobacteria bacterium]